MALFDIQSLFINIPLDETIKICLELLFYKKRKVKGMLKKHVKGLLTYAVKSLTFMFNDDYYKKVDGVAMESPLGPTLANLFQCITKLNDLRIVHNNLNRSFTIDMWKISL